MNPKNTLTIFFLLVLTAIVSLQTGHRGNDVSMTQAIAEQSQTVRDIPLLHHHKAKYLADVIPTRVSFPSFSSIDNLAEIPAGQFFNRPFRSLLEKKYLPSTPLLRKVCYHAVNIHAP